MMLDTTSIVKSATDSEISFSITADQTMSLKPGHLALAILIMLEKISSSFGRSVFANYLVERGFDFGAIAYSQLADRMLESVSINGEYLVGGKYK